VVHIEVNLTGVDVLERLSPVPVSLFLYEVDPLGDAVVGFDAGSPQIIQIPVRAAALPWNLRRKQRAAARRTGEE
jgi:hypothetical protein